MRKPDILNLGLPQNARALGPAGLCIAVGKTYTKIRAFSRNFSHAWESPTIQAESPAKSWKPNAGGKNSPWTNWPRGHLADTLIFAHMMCSLEFEGIHVQGTLAPCADGRKKNRGHGWLGPSPKRNTKSYVCDWTSSSSCCKHAPSLIWTQSKTFLYYFQQARGPAFVQCLPSSAGNANEPKTFDWPATALSLLLQMTSCSQLEVKQCDSTQTIAQT